MVEPNDETDEIDCRSVIEEMYLFLDGEVIAEKRTLIVRHVHGCVDCHELVDFHAELKMLISTRCREQVPDELRDRIARALGLVEDTE